MYIWANTCKCINTCTLGKEKKTYNDDELDFVWQQHDNT